MCKYSHTFFVHVQICTVFSICHHAHKMTIMTRLYCSQSLMSDAIFSLNIYINIINNINNEFLHALCSSMSNRNK